MRFIFGTDLHGIEQDKGAVASFLEHTKQFKPDLKVFGGDLWNFAALRRKADENERVIRLKEDFVSGLEFLKEFHPSVVILGNHDIRLWDRVKRERVKSTGWLAELCETYLTQALEFAEKHNIRLLRYETRRGVYKVKGMSFAHGFGSGDSLTQKMAEVYGNVIHGHGHKIERVTAMCSGYPVTGYQVGCLCRNDMDYARADLGALRQEQGWGYGILGRHPEVFQARYVNGRALVASDFKEI